MSLNRSSIFDATPSLSSACEILALPLHSLNGHICKGMESITRFCFSYVIIDIENCNFFQRFYVASLVSPTKIGVSSKACENFKNVRVVDTVWYHNKLRGVMIPPKQHLNIHKWVIFHNLPLNLNPLYTATAIELGSHADTISIGNTNLSRFKGHRKWCESYSGKSLNVRVISFLVFACVSKTLVISI